MHIWILRFWILWFESTDGVGTISQVFAMKVFLIAAGCLLVDWMAWLFYQQVGGYVVLLFLSVMLLMIIPGIGARTVHQESLADERKIF